ncbi:winged helix-turn-helix domain-containing protein [Candidatus Nitrososphaera evergladensis]|uniref:winged helix-turn-helix domain-containing protein n=1 Tax=Candidatus Nitrososphaera evergladensis TaxID=1459637 RepID=UPI001D0519D5|nr:winged helix-turn-helix domain-containing protein [Candidatus Nitrososphaera evergladensis]
MKRSANRSRVEIAYDILKLCLTPQKKTQIMYRANLSYEQANYYLAVFVTKGLLEQNMRQGVNDQGYRQYLITTQKGRDVLQGLANAIELLDSIFATTTTKIQASA